MNSVEKYSIVWVIRWAVPWLDTVNWDVKVAEMYLTPETAMYDRSAASFCARSGQNRSGRSLTSCCLLFYSFINSGPYSETCCMNEKLTGDATRWLNIHEKIRVQPLTVKHYNELFLAASTQENSIVWRSASVSAHWFRNHSHWTRACSVVAYP